MPGLTNSPARRRTSAAIFPAWRMREITSGVLIADSFHRRTSPDSAYGGRGICAGTVRIGLTTPGRTLPSSGLWQRLYLRPLPHQQDSFAAGGIAGGEVGDAVLIRFKATANQPTGLGFKSLTCNSDDFLARVDLSSARPFQSLRNTHSTIGGLVATKEGNRGFTAQFSSIGIKGVRRGRQRPRARACRLGG
jgi:hypothetical protein